MIPITRLSVGQEEAKAAAETVMSGWLTVGKRCESFEQAIARYVGAEHAVTVNSCTTALHLALVAAGVKQGDEVICPSFSFIASANAILYAGARPRFVDIDPRTYNIDPGLIEAAITEKTRAVVPVSQIGLGADIPAIREIAKRHNLKVVEDAAPSMGAVVAGKFIGSMSDFTCFSFDARKILTTGEGGVITTNDTSAATRLRQLRAHAASTSTADEPEGRTTHPHPARRVGLCRTVYRARCARRESRLLPRLLQSTTTALVTRRIAADQPRARQQPGWEEQLVVGPDRAPGVRTVLTGVAYAAQLRRSAETLRVRHGRLSRTL